MSHDLAYYMANEAEFNALTEEQVIALSQGETIEPEAKEEPVENGETTEEVESEASPDPAPEVDKPVEEEKEPVLLAKDGKHVIPYSRLQEATEKAAQWEAFAREQADLVESLKEAKAEDAKTGGTEAQEAVLADYSGEFPEVVQDMKPYIQSMIDAGVKAKMSELEQRLNSVVAPMQKQAQESAVEAHFNAIRSAVPEFDTLVESGEVQEWVKTLPKFMQGPANAVLEGGTASEVIELFSTYKAALPSSQSAPSKDEVKQKANAVIAKAKAKTPASLTDIPSGTIAATDEIAAMAQMNASQLMQKFEGKSPDQILKLLARVA